METPNILVITGAQGTGKSTVARFIERCTSDVLVLDDWKMDLNRAKTHNGPVVVVVQSHSDEGVVILELGRRVACVVELKRIA